MLGDGASYYESKVSKMICVCACMCDRKNKKRGKRKKNKIDNQQHRKEENHTFNTCKSKHTNLI